MINKKKGPGRPQKKFIPTPKAKKAGPGRPKKEIKIYDAEVASRPSFKGFVTKNILHAPQKDNIILLMFVLSLLLFLFSLYVAVLREQKRIEWQQTIAAIDTELPVANVETGNIPYQDATTGQTAPQIQIDAPQQWWDKIMTAFYDAMNTKNFSAMYALVDKPLKNAAVFKTYYSKNWINQFLEQVPQGVQIQNIQSKPRPETSSAQIVDYTLTYTRKNGSAYTETRSAILVKRGEEYKIGKIMCTTVKCSLMPFFNIQKYVK